MFKDKFLGPKPHAYEEDGPCTLLECDASFEGKLTFDGTVQISGKFKGEIFSSGILIISDTATVEARIEVGILQIAGTVRGELFVKDRLELLSKAKVLADITTQALVVEQGAQFQGNCQMGLMEDGKTLATRTIDHAPLCRDSQDDLDEDREPNVSLQAIELFQ